LQADNLSLTKAEDIITNDETLVKCKNPSIDQISQIVEKKQSRLDKMFPGCV
jgi:hypothetical protein